MRFSHLVICEHTPVRSVHRHRRQAVTVQPEHLLLLPVLDLPVAVEKRDDTPILPRHRTKILPRLPAEARFPSTFLTRVQSLSWQNIVVFDISIYISMDRNVSVKGVSVPLQLGG